MNLQDQAQEFRHYFGVKNSCDNCDMQLTLIKEEFKEFVEAHDLMDLIHVKGELKLLKN